MIGFYQGEEGWLPQQYQLHVALEGQVPLLKVLTGAIWHPAEIAGERCNEPYGY